MQSQFTKEFVNDICLFYNDNVIVIRKSRRVKESFEIFVKHFSLLSLVVFLIKIIFFSNRKKNRCYISFQYCLILFFVDIEIVYSNFFYDLFTRLDLILNNAIFSIMISLITIIAHRFLKYGVLFESN